MSYENIRLATDARGVATLTLARPALMNAMSVAMMREIHDALDRLHADPDVRVVVLTGEGEAFTSGGDINMFRAMGEAPLEERLQGAFRGITLGHRIARLPMPVVGRINGPAYGGGIGMAAACDITIGVESCRFAFTEVRRGVAPVAAAAGVIARIGAAPYRRLLLTGRRFDAAEALRIGLLDEVVPAAGLDAAVASAVSDLLAGAPGAQIRMKRAIAEVERNGPAADEAAGIYAFAESWASPEGREGAAAFLEKRRPAWDRSGDAG